MGYAFAVFAQPGPLESGAAAARLEELAGASAGEPLTTLLAALLEDCPPAAPDSPWATPPALAGGVLRLAFRDEEVEELAEGFVDLCGEAGLVVFDPQETQLFWPADCVVSELDLLLDDGSRFAKPALERISASVSGMTPGGFAILSRGPDDYVQVPRDEHDGEVILECRRGSEEEHYCCPQDDLDLALAERVFLAYARGDADWHTLARWEQVDFSDDDDYDDADDD
jgi:hypothetical protein